MADPVPQQPGVAEPASSTVTLVSTDTQDSDIPTVRLKLKKPKSDKKVQWTTETVDNEDMNKKKSKCCCIFAKPKKFDESSSSEDSDDECEHCKGHVEKKKHKHKKAGDVPESATIEEPNPTPNENHYENIDPISNPEQPPANIDPTPN